MKKTIIIIIAAAFLAGGAYLVLRGGGADKEPDCALTPWIPACAGMTNKKAGMTNKKAEITKNGADATPAKPGEAAENIIPAPVVAPEAIAEIAGYKYTETYNNSVYGFSFKYPKDFMASDLPSEGGGVILAQNAAKNIGAQIVISPFDGADLDITADYIKSEIPDMKVADPQEVKIGNRQGLAFTSDNEAFGGDSREIWFVFNGSFYQLSSYAESEGFLKGLFGTWKFE
ncbi:MAG: hypothetical protein Q7K35_06090 [bacterium]|nr:hypothetical protein [bacterium]